MAEPPIYRPPEYPKLDADRMVGRDGRPFLADDDLLAAANVALALSKPLLLTGEPGCGKTDFAFAAASGLARDEDAEVDISKPLEKYVRNDTRARDLLYHYDAVRRFGDAQTSGEVGRRRAAFPQNYITLEALGSALISPARRVVLIDEIDKASRDLPNDLLRELDQGWFEIPEMPEAQQVDEGAIDPGHRHIVRKMRAPAGALKPLVVITSNVERQLPDAFLRRCVFFYIPFPKEDRLLEILEAHFPDVEEPLLRGSMQLLGELRHESLRLTKKPATAELINWIAAVRTVFDPADIGRRMAAAVKNIQAREPVPWESLPALGCLVKLREDLRRITAAA